MRLVSIYSRSRWFGLRTVSVIPRAFHILWDLLEERSPMQSISHRQMPEWEQHMAFVASEPYEAWYLIEAAAEYVGSVYLSRLGEIGISIFEHYGRRGYASEAIKLLMHQHPRSRYLANLNPANYASANLFRSLDFKHIQQTYEWRSADETPRP